MGLLHWIRAREVRSVLAVAAIVLTVPASLGGEQVPAPFPTFTGVSYRVEVPVSGRSARDALILEHGAPWHFGDSYFFLKVTNLVVRAPGESLSRRTPSAVYAEWHPRVAVSRLLNRRVGFGPVTDVLLATQVTISGSGTRTHAHGIGIDLDVPTAYLFRAHLFALNDPAQPGLSYKALLVSLHAARVGAVRLRWTAWLEAVGREGDRAPVLSAQGQLYLDVGDLLLQSANHLLAGVIVDAERERGPDLATGNLTARLVVRWKS